MRFRVLVGSLVLGLLVAVPVRADLEDVYVKAYFLIQDGDALEKTGDNAKAIEKYTLALRVVREIRRTSPDWNPNIIAFRTKYCGEHIVKLGGVIEPEGAAPPPVQVQPPLPAPPSAVENPGVPINTVPIPPPAAAPPAPAPFAQPTTSVPPPPAQPTMDAASVERIAGLERELHGARGELQKIRQEKTDLETRLWQAEQKLKETGAGGEERFQALLKENDGLRRSLADVDAKLKETQSNAEELRKAREDRADLEKKLKKTEQRLREAEDGNGERVQSLVKENNALKRSLAEMDAKLKENTGSTPADVRKLREEKAELEKQLRQSEVRLKETSLGTDDRIQALLKENNELRRSVADLEARVKDVNSAAPQLLVLREEVAKTQALLDNARKENDELRKANDGLKRDLEESRVQLKTATGGAGSEVAPEALQTLQRENALLRSIVERAFAEDTRRMGARDALEQELKELGSRAEAVRTHLAVFKAPLTHLSDEERKLLKIPEADIRAVGAGDSTKHPLVGVIPSKPATYSLTGENAVLAREAKGLFEKDELDGAATRYEQILKTEPNNVLALSNLGVIRFRQNQLDAAEKHLRAALALDPQDAFSLSVLGIVQYRQGQDNQVKYTEAINSLTKSIAIKGDNPETHNYLGITYSQTGFQDAAEKELLKAVELKPDYADAHFNLAVVFASQSPPSIELARKHYKQAVELGAAKDAELEKLLTK